MSVKFYKEEKSMKKKIILGFCGFIGVIIVISIIGQALGIIEPKKKMETTTREQQTTTQQQTTKKETTTQQESTTATETIINETIEADVNKKKIYDYYNNLLTSSENPANWMTIGNEDLDTNSDEWKKVTADWHQACNDYEENAIQNTADKFGITVEEVESIFWGGPYGSETSFSVVNGTLVEVIETSDNGLVIKTKIQTSYNNTATINQNYHNIEDIVKNQGGDKYEYIDYWAVADMTDGSEGKVISFTVDKDLIQSITKEHVFAIELGNYVKDLWILPSLLQ